MAKRGFYSIFSSWLKLLATPTSSLCGAGSMLSLKDTRKPVAFILLLLLSIYFLLELYLFVIVDYSPAGSYLPIDRNTSTWNCQASPYCSINAKGLFLGPTDFYIHKPLSIALNNGFHIDLYVSANFVSFLHIVVALLGSQLIANDAISVRRVGVLVYQFRNYLDCLDGVVAKEEHRRRGDIILMNQPTGGEGAFGYFVDGVSDGLGCIFLLTACLVHLQRHPYHRKVQQIMYTPLTSVSVGGNGALGGGGGANNHQKKGNCCKLETNCKESEYRTGWEVWVRKCLGLCRITRAGLPAVLFLNQLLLSSLFWNRNILLYGRMLEPGSAGLAGKEYSNGVASRVLHSPIMWLVIFGWRILNPLFLSDILLLAIFLDRMHEFLHLVQYWGFFVISCVAVVSEAYRGSVHRMMGKE